MASRWQLNWPKSSAKDVSAQKEYLVSEGLGDRVRRVLGFAAALREHIKDQLKVIYKHSSLSCALAPRYAALRFAYS